MCGRTKNGAKPFETGTKKSRLIFLFSFAAVVGELVLIDERDFRKQSWITFEIKLNQILKKGNTDLRKGDFVEFKRRSGCACPELTERKEYLIMGREEGSFFIFDEKSIVIPWVKTRKSSDIRARIGIDFKCSL